MKVFKAIVKIAAAAGAVYVVATYGEEIVSRAKKLWSKLTSGCSCCCTMSAAFDPEEADTEETAAEETETAEESAEEAGTASEPAAPAEEAAPADDTAVTAPTPPARPPRRHRRRSRLRGLRFS